MISDHFFEIPIYRLAYKKFIEDSERYKEKEYEKLKEYKTSAPNYYKTASLIIENTIHTWHFNEIIGWIYLYVFGTQIRADYFYIPNKRIRSGIIKKRYNYCGKILELTINKADTTDKIHNKVRQELEIVAKKPPFAKRFIDLTAFERTFRFVDWRRLVDEYNIYK